MKDELSLIMKGNMAKAKIMQKKGLTNLVLKKLPDGYYVTPDDIHWLNYCSRFWFKKQDNQSIVDAVSTAVEEAIHTKSWMHCDPFELLLDAGICDENQMPK